MARGGIYKSEVMRARDKLLAMGRYPSVDAVRQELGNTGSKTTIQRYLKEIDEEEGGKSGGKVAISEALQDLVARLAERLNMEADTRIADAGEAHCTQIAQLNDMIAKRQDEGESLRIQLAQSEAALDEEKSRHGETRASLRAESLERAKLGQQVADLQERLAAEEVHRRSLEEKHEHARQSLEHFRQAAKEQREQEQRRHEQQVQQLQAELRQAQQTIIVKQDETTRLNQEGARLVAELAHARKEVHEVQGENRRLTQRLGALQGVEQRSSELSALLATQEAHAQALGKQLADAAGKYEALMSRVREMELELAMSQARYEEQRGLMGGLLAYLDGHRLPSAIEGNSLPDEPVA